MSKLEGIKKRAEAYATHGTPGLNAPQDRKDLLAALRAVEAVHQSDGHKQLIGPYCTHCISPIDGGPEMWPCKTLAAIQQALDA